MVLCGYADGLRHGLGVRILRGEEVTHRQPRAAVRLDRRVDGVAGEREPCHVFLSVPRERVGRALMEGGDEK